MRGPIDSEAGKRIIREGNVPMATEDIRMLDALASTGLASRAWWERYLRG